jgi:UDP:flavonoid glycosyltransferase YjiC (YdhE family)
MTDEECRNYVAATIQVKEGYSKQSLMQFVKSEITFFKEHNASTVITGFTLSAGLSARSVGIPLVVTHLGSYVPPIMEAGLFTCVEYFDNFFTSFIPDAWIDRLSFWLYNHFVPPLNVANYVADSLNIERIRSLDDALMGDLTLITDVPEILTIPEDKIDAWKPTNTKFFRPSARLKYAGAIYAKLPGDVPEKIQTFLDTNLPKIYVAMSSGYRKDLQLVYKTLEKMNVRVVVCSTVHNKTFGNAANILVEDFLPSHLIMPFCNLAIIYGGQGTIQTAIASAIPMIGFPLQPEQNFNLKQMERHGAGLCLSRRSLRRGFLTSAINKVLGQKSFRESAQRLQKWQSSRDGPLEVAKIVSTLVAN